MTTMSFFMWTSLPNVVTVQIRGSCKSKVLKQIRV